MIRRTALVRVTVTAVGGGLAMGSMAAAVPPARPQTPAAYPTGQTVSCKVVPMEEFRVGPFFGRVGGPHTGGVHSGLDMGADAGEPVRAIEPGKVVVAGWQGAAGKAVTIRTADGKQILYGHLSKLLADQGDRVSAGTVIGRVGSTGNSTGPHLHLGVTKANGELLDPLRWMDISAVDLRAWGRD